MNSTGSDSPHPPVVALRQQCEALLNAVERNAWEEAEAVARTLLPLVEADRQAADNVQVDLAARQETLTAALHALEAARIHIEPAYQSLQKLLRAWHLLPTDSS
ncbi:hypothetical protein [Hydrogenophilus islandicus]